MKALSQGRNKTLCYTQKEERFEIRDEIEVTRSKDRKGKPSRLASGKQRNKRERGRESKSPHPAPRVQNNFYQPPCTALLHPKSRPDGRKGKDTRREGKKGKKKKIRIIMPRSLNTNEVPLPRTELFKPRDIRIRRGRARGRGW
jgi:hypothetical protein